MQITQRRSYRATLIPADTPADEVELRADRGLLPTLRIRSASADQAAADAHRVSGKAVFKVERLQEAA